MAARRSQVSGKTGSFDHNRDVWLNEPSKEYVLFSDQYDFTISLLHFEDRTARWEPKEPEEEDTYERMINRLPGQSWL